MNTRTLGPGGPQVYPIGFGAMPLSLEGRPSESQAIATIHAALDSGMTLIDTANVYCLDDNDIGHNERLIAKSLKQFEGSRSSLVIATKGGLTRPGGAWECHPEPERLIHACDQSLKALGVTCIDLYQLHSPDPSVPIEDSVGALEQLRRAGKIKWVGLSNVTVKQIQTAQSMTPILTVQNRYNPFFWETGGKNNQKGTVAYCTEQGIGYLAYSPVGGAPLHKTVPDHPAVAAIARRREVSPYVVVLAWLLSKSPVVIPIPGASTPEHAADSASAVNLTLTKNDLEELERPAFSMN